MEVVNVKDIAYDEIGGPPTLYKYRVWDIVHHDRFIKNREVYMASPETFQDDMDCRIPVNIDELSFNEIIQVVEDKNPSISPEQVQNFVKEKLRPGYDTVHLLNYLDSFYNDTFSKMIGILSLTAENHLEYMWNLYANNGKGFCIGYDTHVLFSYLGGGGPVLYGESAPVIRPTPLESIESILVKKVLFKHKRYSREKEYRTYTVFKESDSNEKRRIQLPKEAYKKIILGENISSNHRKEIITAVKNNLGSIPIMDRKEIC